MTDAGCRMQSQRKTISMHISMQPMRTKRRSLSVFPRFLCVPTAAFFPFSLDLESVSTDDVGFYRLDSLCPCTLHTTTHKHAALENSSAPAPQDDLIESHSPWHQAASWQNRCRTKVLRKNGFFGCFDGARSLIGNAVNKI